jgi:nucleotide-binding universal stress UspA family protein
MKTSTGNGAIKNIWLATDNSNAVAAAERYAVELAKHYQCKLTILHVFQATEGISRQISVDEYISQFRNQKVKELANKFEDIINLNKLSAEFIAVEEQEPAAETIISQALKGDADCIVVGSHGSSGYQKNPFGSITMNLIQANQIPLFIIPKHGVFKSLRRVGMACKGNNAEIKLLKWMAQALLIPPHDLRLVHVSSDDDVFELKQFEEEVSRALGDTISVQFVHDTNIERGLNEFMKAHKLDVLVLAGEPKSFFKKIFTPNIIVRMLYHIELPFLYLPSR